MTQHSAPKHAPLNPTDRLGSLIARAITAASYLLYALLPGATPRARYERRHRRLAGPRPGARLG